MRWKATSRTPDSHIRAALAAVLAVACALLLGASSVMTGAPERAAAGTAPAAGPAPSHPLLARPRLSDPTEPGPRQPVAQDPVEQEHPVGVPRKAGGRYSVVEGTDAPPAGSRGKVVRYLVEVEKGLPFDGEEFAAAVHHILNDPRSWGGGGRMRFERVDHGPVRFRVALSSPAMTIVQCLPLRTLGKLSCWNGHRSVINARRWATAIPGYRGDYTSYHAYVINHEVGHALGHDHEHCPGHGRRAPVMLQQTKGLDGCRPNPWPFPDREPPEDKR
ncbi:DUF3152 domain-containing protein [Sphaerisporangium fuscum]|uniref:DUF3152 domain-containing protein n=1 Tax=Sphaerisporangium fuscum TaxID=2835868 RepID=UPI0020299F12|nr:DUF3152 domain-containing protein [Sphaerisporangium fuscum]